VAENGKLLVCRIEESAYGVSRGYTALHRLIFVRNAFSLIREDHYGYGGAVGSLMAGVNALHPSGLLAAKFPQGHLPSSLLQTHHGHKVSPHLFPVIPLPLLIGYRYLILLSRQGKVVCFPDIVLASWLSKLTAF